MKRSLFFLLLVLVVPIIVNGSDLGATGMQTKVGFAAQGMEIALKGFSGELRGVWHGPQAEAAYSYRTPQTSLSSFEVGDKSVVLGKATDAGRVDSALTTDLHRLEIGPKLKGKYRPYAFVERLRCDLSAVITTKEGVEIVTKALGKDILGGGVRVENWVPPLLTYVDTSYSASHHRVQAGFRYHIDKLYGGAGYLYEKFSLHEATLTVQAPVVEVGYAW